MKPFSLPLTPSPGKHPRGFTLPGVLVISAAMLILTVGLLSLVSIERKTARSFVDGKRAELAARAGMEEFRALLTRETANDDFLVIADTPEKPTNLNRKPLPNLFLARGQGGEDKVTYRYLPLFSATERPPDGELKAPEAKDLTGSATKEFETIPGFDKANVAWITYQDEKGLPAGRYAYWVEDLQGKVDAKTAGNLASTGGTHQRAAYPFPAAGVNPEPLSSDEPRLNQVAIHALDPTSGDDPKGTLTKTLHDNRKLMLSPASILPAAEIHAPLTRDKTTDLLTDKLADALETSVSPVLQSYKERPTVPFARGISVDVAGQPKLNLNRLLAESNRNSAVEEFADWVNRGLPQFDKRKGGFPEDYTKTLAAGAFDYADNDSDPTVAEGSYRGLDANPLLSEIVLQVNYEGVTIENGQRILNFRIRMFAELWNMTNKEVNGSAQFSYELDLKSSGVGSAPAGRRFDDPSMMNRAVHNLSQDGLYYWSPSIAVSLKPDRSRFYETADVRYKISAGLSSDTIGNIFSLSENEGSSGMSLKWNSIEVDRCARIKHIDAVYPDSPLQFQFNVNIAKTVSKGAVPGQSYRGEGTFANNMGDPRASYYLREVPLDENAYPENLSPYRRNIRWRWIYSVDGATKPMFFGRALPSEWPDGGHDSPVSTWAIKTDPKIIPTDTAIYPIPAIAANSEHTAPQRISNLGRFYSATELGRVYDPLMWQPTYESSSDNATFNPPGTTKPQVPSSQHWLPEVLLKSDSSAKYGGGSTLRIGRPEHPAFDVPGQRAANLLDLFHAGESTSEVEDERNGDLITMAGNVNLNTASRDAIRALAVGYLTQDPAIGRVTNWSHQTTTLMAPPVQKLSVGTPTKTGETLVAADRVADAIIKCRPYASAGELTAASETPRTPGADRNKPDLGAIFGNRRMYAFGDNLQWNDAAAEEVFARIYEASTFRSRNFRIWVIGQALAPSATTGQDPEVLAESRKVYTLFADPGTRKSDGSIDSSTYHPRVIHENDF